MPIRRPIGCRRSTALGAEVVIAGPRGERRDRRWRDFVRGAMETELADDELIVGIRVPRFSRAARFGFHKICRKTGEFAEAIGVAVHDPEPARALRLRASAHRAAGRSSRRIAALPNAKRPQPEAAAAAAGFARRRLRACALHAVALQRAIARRTPA